MANHLLIGLGGTGGKILREYRKRYFEQYKGFNPQENTFIDYLYVETSANDVEMNDWNVMGTSVKLADHQVLSAHTNPEGMLERITEFPKLNSFISSKDISLMRGKSNDLITSGVASQRRRLGRVLFTVNVTDYLKAVKDRVDSLKNLSGDADVSFHICAGLAGGTGSGMIVDAIAQIHKLYSNNGTRELKIYLYLFVPEETNPNPNKDAYKFYQANGYAALLELNAWSVGVYKPIDITEGKTSSGELSRVEVFKQPFKYAYLFSDTNEDRKHLDKDTGLPQMVADFLFQITIGGGLNDALLMARDSENAGWEPEKDADTGKPTHSRRFISFGLQRVVFPEKEIKESLACEYAASSVYQILYNDWNESYGQSEIEVFDPEIIHRAKGADYSIISLTDEILTFEDPIEPNELTKHWGGKFKDYWHNLAQNIQGNITLANDNKDNWIQTFNQKIEEAYKKSFRRDGTNGGVQHFFDTQTEHMALGNTAATIVRKIESHLFTEWKAGRMSLVGIRAYLKILIDALANKKQEFSNKHDLAEVKIKKLMSDKAEYAHKFRESGFIRALTGARKEDFSAYVKVSTEIKAQETLKASYKAAYKLLPAIETRLSDLLSVIVNLIKGFDDVAEHLKKTYQSHELPQSGISSEGKAFFYDKDAIKECERITVNNKQLQDDAAQRVRNSIIQCTGPEKAHTFSHMKEKFFSKEKEVNQSLLNILLKESLISVSLNLDDIAKANPAKSVTKVNIIQKIYQELGENDGLQLFMSSLKNNAKTYLEFNSVETESGGLSGRFIYF